MEFSLVSFPLDLKSRGAAAALGHVVPAGASNLAARRHLGLRRPRVDDLAMPERRRPSPSVITCSLHFFDGFTSAGVALCCEFV